MFEHLGNLMETMKKVQQSIETVQAQLKNERIEVSGGDAVKVVMDGRQTIVAVTLSPSYLAPSHAQVLQDLLVTTLNQATAKSRELHDERMGQLASAMNLPKIPGLL